VSTPAAVGASLDRLQGSPPLRPFVKWPGGKSAELGEIAAVAPALGGRYVDPFVGGGSVLLAVPASVPAVANDACPELVRLYAGIAERDPDLTSALNGVAAAWDAVSELRVPLAELAAAYRAGADPARVARACEALLASDVDHLRAAGPGLAERFSARLGDDVAAKLARMRGVEARAGHALSDVDLLANVEGAVKAALYLSVRERYNAGRAADDGSWWRVADFVFLREYAYAAMFRFNARGEFNVPYGGVSYNGKSLRDKLDRAYRPEMVERLARTTWGSGDFEPFLAEVEPTGGDFVFVDPPYDSDFSDYDNRAFTTSDQARLEAVLRRLSCPVMVVIKQSPLVRELYSASHWNVRTADKTYMWTIKSRNDRSAVHLTITNY